MGVALSPETLEHIRQVASNIHHGRIIIEINSDKADRVDVLVEYRERFKGTPPDLVKAVGIAASLPRVSRTG